MSRNKKYDLTAHLHTLLKSESMAERTARLNLICRICHIPASELVSLVKETSDSNGTLGNLKYRVLGWMQKRKMNTAHLE